MTSFSSVSWALAGATVVSGALATAGAARGARHLVHVFKPLATALLVALVLLAPAPPSERYRLLLAGGLLFSLAGDVFLMLPEERFLAGLGSFLAAHVLYAAAFLGTEGAAARLAPALGAYLLVAALLVRWLWAGVPPRLRGPVAVYAAALSTMAASALARALTTGGSGAWAAETGALVFVASDALLAADRFRGPIRHARPAVLGTYYAAQLAIALSATLPS